MKIILEALESNDSRWAINSSCYEDFYHVAKSFGYKFESHKTANEVQEFLKDKIKNTLSGKDFSNTGFKVIQDQLAFRFFSSDNTECKNALKFVGLIKFITNGVETYTSAIESWLLVRDYLEAYLAAGGYKNKSYLSLYDSNKHISESIKFLRKNRYKVKIVSGEVFLDKESDKIFLATIKYRFKKLGYHALNLLILYMGNYYDPVNRRYYFRPEPSVIGECKTDIPLGYLFNLSLANLHNVKASKNTNKIFSDCLELTKHYFGIKNLKAYNKFSDAFHTHETILNAIQKNILYDQYFAIDQISSKHIVPMIEGMFLSPLISSLNLNINLYIDILKWVNDKANHTQPLHFFASDLLFGLDFKYFLKDIEEALSFLSLNSTDVNRYCLNPEDISKRNYFEKPLVLINEQYVYVNPVLSNYGFYNCLLQLCLSNGAKNNLAGILAEELVESLFKASGVHYFVNKEYKIPKNIANELGITSQKRESDFIVETEDTIIFIEIKRKTLTSEARAGDTLKSMVDISQSLFHALAQTGCHEYILRRNGKIVFDDGTVLTHDGREVERVALSLFGFFGIQDGAFVQQVLSSLINAKIDSGNKPEDEKVNRYLTELRNQYLTDIFNNIYCQNHVSFFNCRFFSVPQLVEVLLNSKNNQEFLKELNRTRHMSTGCKDWFKDYQYLRKLGI